MQGWESVCCGVAGTALIEKNVNKSVYILYIANRYSSKFLLHPIQKCFLGEIEPIVDTKIRFHVFSDDIDLIFKMFAKLHFMFFGRY